LVIPGTFQRKMPASPKRAIAPPPTTLPALGRRRPGFRRRGKSCTAGGSVADDGPVVLCRVKFTEGLPFVIRQDADVAVNNQSLGLITLPSVGERQHRTDQLALEIQQVGRLNGCVGPLGKVLGATGWWGDNLLERLVLEPHIQLEIPLGD